MTVSIIIPVYNAEQTIIRCLESILSNTYHEYEIIAINDGSRDGSWDILNTFSEKYPEKIKIFNQINQGVAKTRNSGIRYATGEYIMFIDCDDDIENDYIEKFVTKIQADNADIIIGGYKRTTSEKVLFEMQLQNTLWSRYMIMAPWSKIYRREFIVKNHLEFLDNNIGEDVYFNMQAIHLTDRIPFIAYSGYHWFYNEVSISNTHQKTLQKKMNVQILLDACYKKLDEQQCLKKEEVEFYFIRYIVWYILFAGRNSCSAEIIKECAVLFSWLQNHFPKFLQNKNISFFLPKGETLRNRIVIVFFLLLYRWKILPVFFAVYAKGER